jgi:CHAT domain-containing protein
LIGETDNYITILTDGRDQLPEWSNEMAKVVLSSKGLLTDVISERYQVALDEGDEEAASLADSLKEARFKLAKLQLDDQDECVEQRRQNLDAAVEEKERLEVALARRSVSFSTKQRIWNATPQDIAAALPDESALVEFMLYQHYLNSRRTEPRFLAIVIRAGMTPSVIDLGKAEPIERTVAWYRSHFDNFASQDSAVYEEISREFYNLVWQPIAPLLNGVQTVFIAPDGELNLISFAGIKQPCARYLIEDFALHYLATGRDLIRLNENEENNSNELLAFGDPAYDASMEERCQEMQTVEKEMPSQFEQLGVRGNMRSGCEALQERNWSRLAASRHEVEQLASLWTARGNPSHVYMGSQASEERFKHECSGK